MTGPVVGRVARRAMAAGPAPVVAPPCGVAPRPGGAPPPVLAGSGPRPGPGSGTRPGPRRGPTAHRSAAAAHRQSETGQSQAETAQGQEETRQGREGTGRAKGESGPEATGHRSGRRRTRGWYSRESLWRHRCRYRRPLTRSVDNSGGCGQSPGRPMICYEPNPPSVGSEMSGFSSSSTLTSLKVMTRTFFTNRAGRYMSQTQASCISTSK